MRKPEPASVSRALRCSNALVAPGKVGAANGRHKMDPAPHKNEALAAPSTWRGHGGPSDAQCKGVAPGGFNGMRGAQ
eukprot:6982327-Alexandrium_andersonii.AAC.1